MGSGSRLAAHTTLVRHPHQAACSFCVRFLCFLPLGRVVQAHIQGRQVHRTQPRARLGSQHGAHDGCVHVVRGRAYHEGLGCGRHADVLPLMSTGLWEEGRHTLLWL